MKTRYANRRLKSLNTDNPTRTSAFRTLSISDVQNIDYTQYNGMWELQSTSDFPKKQTTANTIRVVDSSMNLTNSSVSQINVTVPSAVVSGDLIVIIVASSSFVAGSPVYLFGTTYKPTNFTHIITYNPYSSSSPKIAAYYKYANGSESNTVISCPAGSAGKMWASCMVIRNVKSSSPVRGSDGASTSSTSTSLYTPAGMYFKNSMLVRATTIIGTNYAPFKITSTLNTDTNRVLDQYFQYNTDDLYYANNPQEKISTNISGLITYAIGNDTIINTSTITPSKANPSLGVSGSLWFLIDGV